MAFVVNVENDRLSHQSVGVIAPTSGGAWRVPRFGTVKISARSVGPSTDSSRLPWPLGGVSGPSTSRSAAALPGRGGVTIPARPRPAAGRRSRSLGQPRPVPAARSAPRQPTLRRPHHATLGNNPCLTPSEVILLVSIRARWRRPRRCQHRSDRGSSGSRSGISHVMASTSTVAQSGINLCTYGRSARIGTASTTANEPGQRWSTWSTTFNTAHVGADPTAIGADRNRQGPSSGISPDLRSRTYATCW